MIVNDYYEKDGYMVGTCSDGSEFYIDKEDYDRVKYLKCWHRHDRGIYYYENSKRFSLPKFILNMVGTDERILHKNGNHSDNRKSNLYHGNEYIDCGDYYEVLDFSNRNFYIDKEDYEIVKQYRWELDRLGYAVTQTKERSIKLHRLLLNVLDTPLIEVDHINRNPSDNRRRNLRLVDRSTNMVNTGLSSRNTSGYKGVSWDSKSQKWSVEITRNKQKYYLGSFDNKEDAINARKRAEEEFDKVI